MYRVYKAQTIRDFKRKSEAPEFLFKEIESPQETTVERQNPIYHVYIPPLC